MTDDNVLFRMQVTKDGVLTISRLPKVDHVLTPENVVATILRTVADSLESGSTRLAQGEVPE